MLDPLQQASWWKYERAMLKHATGKTGEGLKVEIAKALLLAIFGAAAEVAITGTLDTQSAKVGLAVGALEYVVSFLIHLFAAPVEQHNAMTQIVHEKTVRASFGALLRKRWEEMIVIHPMSNDDTGVAVARNRLISAQVRVIGLLREPDSVWGLPPIGWDTPVHPIHAFGALVAVMGKRYPNEIVAFEHLFDAVSGDMAHTTLANFPMTHDASMQCVDLIVREIEHPDSGYVKRRIVEPDGLYLKTVERFKRPPSNGASHSSSSSSAASPPSSPEQQP